MKYIFIIFRAIFTLPNIILFKKFVGRDKDFLIVKNSNIESISQLILSEFKNNFFKINEIKDKKLKENNKDYHFNITSFFQKKTLDEIENQLKNKNLLSNISNHFGFKIRFSQFMIRYNYYNPLSPEQFGPKMWHRDNDSLFNQLKLFLVINEISESNGGYFYFIPQKYLPNYIKLSSQYQNKENFIKSDRSSRIKNQDIENKYKFTNKITKYGDDQTSALILDTNDTYHKGGFIKKEDGYRVLLQAIYEPKYLSLSNYSEYSKNILYRSLKIFLLGIKNRLRKNI